MQVRAGDVLEVGSPHDANAEIGGALAWHGTLGELEDRHVTAIRAAAASEVTGAGGVTLDGAEHFEETVARGIDPVLETELPDSRVDERVRQTELALDACGHRRRDHW